jgi:hypothetical protein
LIIGATAGLFRKVRKPTTTGIAMKITDKHRSTKPAVGGSVPELLTPFNSVLNGILPDAVKAPKIHKNNPGHPHKTTEATVAIIPLVLSSMIHSPSEQIN